MAFPSMYAGKCKDCGTSYEIGDMIEPNGNKSPNKMGEMKDHWCKMGKNCQGMMQFGTTTTGNDKPKEVSKDPTSEQFLTLGVKMLSLDIENPEAFVKKTLDETNHKIAIALIKRSAIEKAMNDLGLQHPSRIAFIKDVLR